MSICNREIFQKLFKSPASVERPTLRFVVSRINVTKSYNKDAMKADIKRLLELCPKELINKTLSSSDYWDESVGDEVVRMSSPKAKSKPTKEERKLERRKRLIDNMQFSDGNY